MTTPSVTSDGPPRGISDLGAIALAKPAPDCFLICCSADSDNNAVVVWGRGARSDRMVITRQRDDEVFATVDTPARNWLHRALVQPLPGGDTLLVAPRMLTRDDRNAIVIDSSGDTVREGSLGDGIEHVLTTTLGDIWVGYFDEGVYGRGVGAGGIVRFDSQFNRIWGYNDDARAEDEPGISDCYSLNVTDLKTFACPYQYFPILEIEGSISRRRLTGASGVRHILVNHDRAALLGGYDDRRDHVSIGRLQTDQFFEQVSATWAFSKSGQGPFRPTVVSRGAQLNVFDRQTWFRYQLD